MKTISFTKHLKSKGLQNVFPNNIPSDLSQIGGYSTSVHDVTSTRNKYIKSGTLSYMFLIVGNDLNNSESKANDVLEWLLNNSLVLDEIEDIQILDLYVREMKPNSLGVDDQKRYRWSFNIDILVRKLN